MIRWGLVFGALVSLPFWGALACYEHNKGPVTSCAANPWQEGCLPPVHDERAPDAGR